jgi:hypothetical protein
MGISESDYKLIAEDDNTNSGLMCKRIANDCKKTLGADKHLPLLAKSLTEGSAGGSV